jgi:uncharacterized iron-regulated membrane protein
MLSELVRVYKTVHTWTGLIAGMALFIAFYAGAVTVFKEPLARWASPPTIGVNAVSLEQSHDLIKQTLASYPQAANEFFIHLQAAENLPARMQWKISEEGADEHDNLSQSHYIATLDVDGAAVVNEIQPSQLVEFIDVLHRVVGLPFDTEYNRWIMGIIAVLYSLALLSGLIVLLPTLTKDFFAMRLGKNLKRMWLDAHNVVGIVSLPFHLMIALTAVGFAYHDGIYVTQNKVIHDGKLASAFRSGLPAPDPSPKDLSTLLAPTDLVQRTLALSPEFEPTMLQYARLTGPMPMVRVWGRDQHDVGPRAWGGFAVLNPYTGKVLSTDYLPNLQGTAFKAVSTIFSLHFVTFGGILEKWVYFLLAIAGAWLFYSGNILWIETRRRKQRRNAATPKQRRNTQLMASATVGVSLGCICGISASIMMAKWLTGVVANLTAWHQGIYYLIFFVCISWAFLRGAARSVVHLLWLAGVLTLAIPLTSLVAWAFPALGMWAHLSLDTLSVDFTALIAALCFFYLAQKTAQRVRYGAPDSIWYGAPNA